MASVSIFLRGGVWYARWWEPVGQKDRRQSLKTTDERTAKRRALDLEERLEREAVHPGARYDLTLEALVARFLAHQRQQVSREWYGQQVSHLAAFQSFCPVKQAARVRPPHVRAFLSSLSSGRSPATVNRYRASLSALFSWAWREEILSENPVARTRQLREEQRVVVFLADKELDPLLEGVAGTRLLLPVALGALAGLRRGEVCALRREDVEEGWLLVRRSRNSRGREVPIKNRRERRVPVCPRLAAILAESAHSCDVVAPRRSTLAWRPAALTRAIARLGRTLGLPKLRGPQILRRTAATRWLAEGASLYEVAGWLGDTIQVTERNYAGLLAARRK